MISHLLHSSYCPFYIIAVPKSTHCLKSIRKKGQTDNVSKNKCWRKCLVPVLCRQTNQWTSTQDFCFHSIKSWKSQTPRFHQFTRVFFFFWKDYQFRRICWMSNIRWSDFESNYSSIVLIFTPKFFISYNHQAIRVGSKDITRVFSRKRDLARKIIQYFFMISSHKYARYPTYHQQYMFSLCHSTEYSHVGETIAFEILH